MKATSRHLLSEVRPREPVSAADKRLAAFVGRMRAELQSLKNFVDPDDDGASLLSVPQTVLSRPKKSKSHSEKPRIFRVIYDARQHALEEGEHRTSSLSATFLNGALWHRNAVVPIPVSLFDVPATKKQFSRNKLANELAVWNSCLVESQLKDWLRNLYANGQTEDAHTHLYDKKALIPLTGRTEAQHVVFLTTSRQKYNWLGNDLTSLSVSSVVNSEIPSGPRNSSHSSGSGKKALTSPNTQYWRGWNR